MIDHGYIGNYGPTGEMGEPCYIDEEFVDAHSDEESIEDSSLSNESATDARPSEATSTICPPAIELPSSFPILASGCLKVPRFTNYAVDFVGKITSQLFIDWLHDVLRQDSLSSCHIPQC